VQCRRWPEFANECIRQPWLALHADLAEIQLLDILEISSLWQADIQPILLPERGIKMEQIFIKSA